MSKMEPIKRFNLTNVELGALYLFLNGPSRAVGSRKAMYLQRFGTMQGWTRGHYVGYFMDGHFVQSRYVTTKKNEGLWKSHTVDNHTVWTLTSKGMLFAERAIQKIPVTQRQAAIGTLFSK